MALTQAQIKGRINNIAKDNKADARMLMRIYMMERFLERVAFSPYADKFIIKGGILVTSMIGVSKRSTMDIDASIRNYNLSEKDAVHIVSEICSIDGGDGITFVIRSATDIMDDMEYPGIRLMLDSVLGKMITPIKIDISTGDIITPSAIEYNYPLMLEERSIRLLSYNLETILAEKIQTILARGVLNTRMRDFYDVYTLSLCYADSIDEDVLRQAFRATCQNRNSVNLMGLGGDIIRTIAQDDYLIGLWNSYQNKYDYAAEISFENALESVSALYERIRQ